MMFVQYVIEQGYSSGEETASMSGGFYYRGLQSVSHPCRKCLKKCDSGMRAVRDIAVIFYCAYTKGLLGP